MAKAKPIIVTVSDAGLKDIQKIADSLAEKGMTVKRVMPGTGVIAGLSPSSKLDKLKEVTGVESVADDTFAELPPPNSKLQ